MKIPARSKLVKTAFDVALIVLVVWVVLLSFGVIRRGGRFTKGKPAPAVSVLSLENGQQLHLSDFAGKPLVLTFFSTNCPSCIRELPDLEKLKDEAGDAVEVLIVTLDPPKKVRAYMKQQNFSFHVAYDAEGVTHDAYNVDTIPYNVLITADGQIQDDIIGGLKRSDFGG